MVAVSDADTGTPVSIELLLGARALAPVDRRWRLGLGALLGAFHGYPHAFLFYINRLGTLFDSMEARYVELLVDWVRGEARADDVVELIEAAAGFWHIYHWTCYGAPGEPSDVAPLRRVAGRAVA